MIGPRLILQTSRLGIHRVKMLRSVPPPFRGSVTSVLYTLSAPDAGQAAGPDLIGAGFFGEYTDCCDEVDAHDDTHIGLRDEVRTKCGV